MNCSNLVHKLRYLMCGWHVEYVKYALDDSYKAQIFKEWNLDNEIYFFFVYLFRPYFYCSRTNSWAIDYLKTMLYVILNYYNLGQKYYPLTILSSNAHSILQKLLLVILLLILFVFVLAVYKCQGCLLHRCNQMDDVIFFQGVSFFSHTVVLAFTKGK